MLGISLPGTIVPVLTPFATDGSVDEVMLAREIEYLVSTKPAMLSVAALEGQEYQYLSDRQRVRLIRKTMQLVNGRIPTLVGISHTAYVRTLDLGELAREIKANAVIMLLPRKISGGAVDHNDLRDYVEAVSKNVGLPTFIYHNPAYGIYVTPGELVQLLRLQRVVGCKESSRNAKHVGEVLASITDKTNYFVPRSFVNGNVVGSRRGDCSTTCFSYRSKDHRLLSGGQCRIGGPLSKNVFAVFGEVDALWAYTGFKSCI